MIEIIQFFARNANALRWTVFVGIIIALFLSVKACTDKNTQLALAEQNYAALSDSTRMVTNKAGELEAERLSLIVDRDRLKSLNARLYAEMEKENGNVKYIQRTEVRIVHDTLSIPHTITRENDSTYALRWDHEKSDSGWYRKISGTSRFGVRGDSLFGGNTTIDNDILGLTLVTGLREKDDKIEIFARTTYPDARINIEGAIIDPENSPLFDKFRKSKRFSIGPNISCSVGTDGIVRGTVGIGLQYAIVAF